MDIKTKKFIKELLDGSSSTKSKITENSDAIWVESDSKNVPDLCVACVSLSGVFDSAFVYPYYRSKKWVAAYFFRIPKITKVLVVWTRSNIFYSVSGLVPAALWDERKMHEISEAKFINLADQRPIVIHPESARYAKTQTQKTKTAEYTFLGTGAEEEFQIPVGPVHAGIIEPGHFRFHVIGEKINKLEVRLSYLHKGIESLAENKIPESILPLIEQISGDESVANSVAYAQAVESAAKIKVPSRAESLRLILLEMERIYNHLADLGGMSMDIGYYASSSQFLVLREEMMRLNEKTSGNRFLRSIISVGGVANDISSDKLHEVKSALKIFIRSLLEVESLTMSSSTFLDRVFTTGRVFPQTAKELSLVGPVARASGISCDLRKHFPYGTYKTDHVNEVLAEDGDVLARFMVKLGEIKESVRLIDLQINKIVSKSASMQINGKISDAKEGSSGIGMCEASRGACTFFVQFGEHGKISRLSIRTASFRNWRAIEKAVKSNIIADFPLINKSFNLSYSGADL